ncbi:MAG: PAS domain S-box protein [Crocinitomicaceae bacterium]|nr:PAS domain S-box protein [Crocinitomicaceae bacterium]
MKVLLSLLFAVFFAIVANAQLYTFQNYTHRDGLSMSKINTFEQSDDGYLWMGADGTGLIRFDGKKFKEISMKNSDGNFHCEHIVSKEDDIYFATSYTGFHKFSRTNKTVERLDKKEVKIGDGRKIIVQESCTYFIGVLGISRSKDGKETLTKKFSKRLDNGIAQVIETPYGVIATSDEGIFYFQDDAFKEIKNNSGTSSLGNYIEFQFGWFKSNKLTLFNSTFDSQIVIQFDEKGNITSINQKAHSSLFNEGEYVVSADFHSKNDQRALLTNEGRIFTEKSDTFRRIAHNYLEPFQVPDGISIGNNGEFWISSGFTGVFKVSIEPFTKVQLSDIFTSPAIGFPFVHDSTIALSLMTTGTHIGQIKEQGEFEHFPIRIFESCEIKGTTFLATSDGIKKYVHGTSNPFEDFLETGKQITFVHEDGFDIWYGIRAEGLARYNIVTQKRTYYGSTNVIPHYVYTAQTTFRRDFIYFGSNQGVFKFDKEEKEFSRVKTGGMGSYSGVSAMDEFRNLWFTLDKGIVGIVNEKVVSIDVSKISPSSVFYTLNADKYGNLILGTNKGVTIIKVNANGKVTSSQNYSGGTGFEGYETHMRSQFQIGNNIYVGTIEGLFLINTDILENLPPPISPIIKDISDENIKDSRSFYLSVNNARVPLLRYRYRILELGNEWIDNEKNSKIRLHELSSGDYTIEVAASYDGIVYGEPSTQKFTVDLPLWNSKWFVVLFVLIVLLLNVLLLVYGNRYDSSRLLSTKDTELHIQMAPTTLLFGAIVSTATQLIGHYYDPTLIMNLGLIFAVAFIMTTLYFISLWAKKNGMQHLYKYLLSIGIYVIALQFFWESYETNLHPFHLMGVILTTSVAPFLLNRIANTVTFGIVVFLLAILCIIFVDDPIYSRINYMIGIISAIGLLIVNTYLRYNSLEKLMFISGIINRGNFPVVAYKADGTITYVSENISQFADITHEDLLNNKISFLNTFVPFDDRYKAQDATVEFVEGSKYLIPMADGENTVRWMEWSYKRFSENTRVIIGQDVSERIELQNTYELLVQNVEDLIFTVDINGDFVFLNETFLSRTGYAKEELVGKNSMMVVAEDCREEIAYFYRSHFLEKKESSYKELPIITKSGETIWIGQYVNTIYTPGTTNHVKGFISLARDITDLREQQKLMTAQRDDITASINYAQRIQFNLLPNEEQFEEHFSHHFIMFSPKDIVSGDFYWMQKIDDKLVLALGDCTGHGVPGAFMTLLGINLLNNIVLEARLTEPGLILNELDKRLQEYFGATGKAKMTDGMELTICVMDDLKEEVAYACAGSRFLINNTDGFTLFKGNSEHIGDQKPKSFKGYITQYTDIGADDTVYFYTDGFQDQFGGAKNKKYSFRRMLDLFESNVNLSLEDQRMMIEAEFDQWMSNQPQTDDVTVIGVQRRCNKQKS